MNLQNIPSHEQSIRMMFVPSINYEVLEVASESIDLFVSDEVQLADGKWISVSELHVGDTIIVTEDNVPTLSYVSAIEYVKNVARVTLK